MPGRLTLLKSQTQTIPRSCLHALELEEQGIGKMCVKQCSIVYIELTNKQSLCQWTYKDKREANLQLSFFRVSYSDRKKHVHDLTVIQGGKS